MKSANEDPDMMVDIFAENCEGCGIINRIIPFFGDNGYRCHSCYHRNLKDWISIHDRHPLPDSHILVELSGCKEAKYVEMTVREGEDLPHIIRWRIINKASHDKTDQQAKNSQEKVQMPI